MSSHRWLTFLLGSQTDSQSPALLNFFLLMVVFVLQWLSFHWETLIILLSVSIDFQSKSQQDVPFYHAAYEYSRVDWDSLHDHLRDVPWEDIFKLGASAAASEFCERLQVRIDVYIPHCMYQVKPNSSPWFSASCAATIVHRNRFFCLYQNNKPSESKVKFRQARKRCKRVLEAVKFAYANKTKESITSQKLGPWNFDDLPSFLALHPVPK